MPKTNKRTQVNKMKYINPSAAQCGPLIDLKELQIKRNDEKAALKGKSVSQSCLTVTFNNLICCNEALTEFDCFTRFTRFSDSKPKPKSPHRNETVQLSSFQQIEKNRPSPICLMDGTPLKNYCIKKKCIQYTTMTGTSTFTTKVHSMFHIPIKTGDRYRFYRSIQNLGWDEFTNDQWIFIQKQMKLNPEQWFTFKS
jgi:hypothetical protein